MDTSFLFQDCYTGTDFENKIVDFLSKYGFMAQKTGSNDGGIDIVATSDTVPTKYTFNIQCKYFNRPLGKAPIQEVYSGTHYYDNGATPVVIRYKVDSNPNDRRYQVWTNNQLTIGGQGGQENYLLSVTGSHMIQIKAAASHDMACSCLFALNRFISDTYK